MRTRKAGDVLRAFFALPLSDEAREACADVVRELRRRRDGEGVRWVRPEAYHLTLRFLGNVDVEAIPEIAKQVRERVAAVAPFRIRLGSVHAFPSLRNPRVVAAAAEPEEPLAELAARVEEAVVAAGLAPERHRFRAHLTLGRVRNRRVPPLDGAEIPGAPELPVEAVTLFRSDLLPDGAVYTVLERISLGTTAAAACEASEDSP